MAAGAGQLRKVEELISNGADVNEIDENTVWTRTPLITATMRGHIEVVDFLLGQGADTSLVDAAGASPLRTAVQKGYVDIVDALLKAKANSEHDTDGFRRTPLIWAVLYAKHGNDAAFAEIIFLLGRAGAKCQKTFTHPTDDTEVLVSESVRQAGPAVRAAFAKLCPDL
jgi:ankyrin repeat protein